MFKNLAHLFIIQSSTSTPTILKIIVSRRSKLEMFSGEIIYKVRLKFFELLPRVHQEFNPHIFVHIITSVNKRPNEN